MIVKVFGQYCLIKSKKVMKPGSRGGKYWIDKYGNVRYGEKPRDGKVENADTTSKQGKLPWEMTKQQWVEAKGEFYFVDKNYVPKHELYLRFTKQPHQDVINKYSRWYEDDMEPEIAEQEGYKYDEKYDSYYKNHAGLSGHHLVSSENLEDALKEIKQKNKYYRDVNTDDFAIFEDSGRSVAQDTPEGNTFEPKKVLYHKKYGGLFGSGSYSEDYEAMIKQSIAEGKKIPDDILKRIKK